MNQQATLNSTVNCAVCGEPLVYATEPVVSTCAFCGKQDSTLIYCPAGHYVCDGCHSKGALDVLRQVIENTDSSNPATIIEQVMAHPSVPMHGPEHHSIVPASIVAAVRRAGYSVPENAVEKTLARSTRVPGGWCGICGDCGAAVGVGIAISILTSATPLTGKERSLAMAATSTAMSSMLDDQPRCCKRASRVAVRAAVEFLDERLGISLPKAEPVTCAYASRNHECARQLCPFFQ